MLNWIRGIAPALLLLALPVAAQDAETPKQDDPPAAKEGEQPAPKKPADPDKKHPEGVEYTETLPSEQAVGYKFTKRATRDVILAFIGTDDDCKTMAKRCVRMSTIVRATMPKKKRDQPFAAPKIIAYSIPYGGQLDAFIEDVIKPLRVDEVSIKGVKANKTFIWQEWPPFVYVERKKGRKIQDGEQGSQMVHGLAHCYFTHVARISQQSCPVWLSEGYACWVDAQVMSKCKATCVSSGLRGGWTDRTKWSTQIKALAATEKGPPLKAILAAKTVNELSDAKLPKAASVTGYLATTWPEKFWEIGHICAALGPEKGLQTLLGKSVAEIETGWRAWLKKQK